MSRVEVRKTDAQADLPEPVYDELARILIEEAEREHRKAATVA
jgi:hypothetical protein